MARTWRVVIPTVLLLSAGCKLAPDPSKNRCVTDSDCLDAFRCVAGYCIDATSHGFASHPTGGHTCMVRSDDSLWCWGDNQYGQLGLGGTTPEELPCLVGSSVDPGQARWRVVAAGQEHTCAVREDTSLWCWGRGDHGALTGEVSENVDVPAETLRGHQWRTVAAGAEHTCGLEHSGALWCWGNNASGQLGAGPLEATGRLAELAGSWQVVAAWAWQTCGIKEDGTLWCWGTRTFAPETNSTTRGEPTRVDNGSDWAALAVGAAHVCALKEDHSLWCWGDNNEGMLGDGSQEPRESPVGLDGEWLQVTCGDRHTCALDSNHSLWCWGKAQLGQLGSDTRQNQRKPRRVGTDRDWQTVSAGNQHTCAWRQDGSFWCWGDNRLGQVGKGFGLGRSQPTLVTLGSSPWESVATGGAQTCAIGTDQTLWCWGQSTAGEGGWFEAAASPRQVGDSSDWEAVAVGGATTTSESHICATKTDGTLWCWGDNNLGQLGHGSLSEPVMNAQKVEDSGVTNVSSLALGWAHTCIVATTNDTLSCCGLNDLGQLGRETFSDPPYEPDFQSGLIWSDCDVGSDHHRWRSVAAGGAHSCGIAWDHTLWCWGDNTCDQTTFEPTGDCWVGQVGTKNWTSVAAGGRHTCGIDIDFVDEDNSGILRCWGANGSGQVGVGIVSTSISSPRRISSANDWKQVAAGDFHTCAIDVNKALWCWGANDRGQLGLGPGAGAIVDIHTLVDDGADWRQVAAAESHTCGVQADGSLWCWGSNYQGQLGLGGAWYDTPVQVHPN